MKPINLPPRVNHKFRKNGTRFLCQFRPAGQQAFSTECVINDIDEAMSYVSLVVRYVASVDVGKVFDSNTKALIFTCQRMMDPEPYRPFVIREAPPAYGQLVLSGFTGSEAKNAFIKRKKKLETTFAKLRQLHEELNAQLYSSPPERPSIQSPADAASILECFIGHLDHEELWVIDLDTRNRVMGLIMLYKGSVNSSQVRVAEIFRQAIIDNAPSIVVAHNHPSGDPSPSPEDVAVTRAIVQAGKLLDIEVLDHLVIAGGRYVSLKERGLGF